MGFSVLNILDRLNEHLRKDGRPEVGHRAVYSCWLRLRTTQTVINPQQQTGGTKWSHTGHCCVTQKIIQIGILIPLGCDIWYTSNLVPDMFNLEKLMPLTVHQTVEYEKLHKNDVLDGLRAHFAHTKKK